MRGPHAKKVDNYLKAVPEDARIALGKLRKVKYQAHSLLGLTALVTELVKERIAEHEKRTKK